MSVTFTLAEYRETDDGVVLWSLNIGDEDAAQVNVSNANAYAVLDRLGYEVSEWGIIGHAEPDDLLGRALVGNVGRDDSGVDPATVFSGEWVGGGATMIDCGQRPGYFEDVLGRLVALATEAKDRGLLISWA